MNEQTITERSGVQIRLIANDMGELLSAIAYLKKTVDRNRLLWLGRPRKGSKGDCLAYALLIPDELNG